MNAVLLKNQVSFFMKIFSTKSNRISFKEEGRFLWRYFQQNVNAMLSPVGFILSDHPIHVDV